ncbi:MAG TPA: cobalt transporter CbiM [Candidatus Hydrogenedentes bacterium]|nr:cobalt transporter CbiM [Candidatus Hydrogenedentota bacterium]
MHVSEGILSAPVLLTGGVVSLGGLAVGLKSIQEDDMVKVSVLSSALFVATLIKIPLGATSVHLILNGLAGLLLGWQVFPAFAIALILQAILYGFGGFSTLGVNVMIMATPGVCIFYLFNSRARWAGLSRTIAVGFCAGSLSILLSAGILALVLITTGEEFSVLAGAVFVTHTPVMVTEGIVTGAAVSFLRKVRPETLTLAVHSKGNQ